MEDLVKRSADGADGLASGQGGEGGIPIWKEVAGADNLGMCKLIHFNQVVNHFIAMHFSPCHLSFRNRHVYPFGNGIGRKHPLLDLRILLCKAWPFPKEEETSLWSEENQLLQGKEISLTQKIQCVSCT